MRSRFLLIVAVITLSASLRAQVLCVDCYFQNAPVNTGSPNLIINGGMELGTCGGGLNYFCPTSSFYNCDVQDWICSGGGVATYAQVVDAGFSTVPQGTWAAYLGNSFTEACSPLVNDTSCVVDSGCVVVGIPPGYPNNNSGGYGGTTGVSMEQTVTGLTVGDTYILEFWAGGEDFGVFIEEGVFGLDVGYGIDFLRCNGTMPGELGRRYVVTFIANNTSHTIRFTNWGHISGIASEVILDDVQLIAAPAGPAPVAAFTSAYIGGSAGGVGCTLSITATNGSSGGSGAYIWDMGDGTVYTSTDVAHTYTMPGSYDITLIALATNCLPADTAVVTVTVSTGVLVTANGAAVPGSGCAPVQIDFSNTGGGTSWSWDFGDGSPISTLFEPSHLYATPGSYTVTLVANDPGSCNGADTLTIPVVIGSGAPIDALFLYGPGPDCTVPQIATNNLSTGSPVSYTWDMGDGTIYTDTNVVHTYAAPGIYFVELLVEDLSGCSTDDSVTVVVNVAPPVIVNADFTFVTTPSCSGLGVTTTNLSTGSAMSFDWDMGDGIVYQMPFVPMHYYPNPGAYTITLIAYDALACNQSDTMAIVVQVDSVIPPDASFTIVNAVACNQTITTTANTSVGSYLMYDWDMGDGTLYVDTNVVHTYTAPGTYDIVLTVSDTLGCYPADTAMATVVLVPPPPVVAAFSAVQLDDCSNLSVQTANQSTGNNMGYAWDMGDGTTYGNVPNVLHSYSATGNYTIQLVVIDLDGCVPNDTALLSITMVQPVEVVADFSVVQDPVCTSLQVDCQNLSTGPAPTYFWDMGDGTTYVSSDVVDHVYAGPGSYTITLIATDTSTCNDADTLTASVTLDPYVPVAASFVPDQVFDCLQYIVDLSNSSTGSFMAFQWDMGDGTQYTDTNLTHVYANAGTYAVTLVVTDLSGCSPPDTATVQLTIDPIIPVVADFSIAQVGNCTFLTVLGTNESTGDSLAFSWDMGDGTTYTTLNVTHAYAAIGTYPVTLTVEDLGCGDDDVFSTTVTVLDSVPVVATTNGVVCPDSVLAIQANGSPGSTYLWNDGSTDSVLFVTQAGQYFVTVTYNNCVGSDTVEVIESTPQELSYTVESCPNTGVTLTIPFTGTAYQWETGETDQSVYFLFQEADTTSYNFLVWDDYGCVHDDSVTVIPLSGDARLFVPNAFTPDGDGKNDEFVITGYGERDVELVVFNRWGEQIYNTKTLSSPWNGTFNGQIKQDVYVYKLTYNGECTNDETRVIGHVTVVK